MAGTGTFVQEPEKNVDPYGPVLLVTQRFHDTMDYADQWKTLSAAAYVSLTNYVTQLQMPDGWQIAFDDVVIPAINPIDFNSRPSFGSLVLPTDWPDDFPNLPALNSAPITDFSYVKPIKPDQVNPAINYIPGAYDTTLYMSIYTAVYNYIQNPGTGLPQAVEDAIIARRQAAILVATQQKYQSDMRAAGSTGFNFPSGVIAGIQTDSTRDNLIQQVDFNNAVLIQSNELAQKMQFFSLEKGIALETLLRDFYNNTENRSLQSKKDIAGFVLQVYAENVRGYIAEWEGIKDDLEAKIKLVELTLKENELIIEGFKANATAYVSKVEAVSKKIDGLVKGFEGEVSGYEAETKAMEAYYRTLTEQEKSYISLADLKLRKATSELEMLLKSQLSYDQLKVTIASEQGKLAQQAVSGALNAVHASASLGYNGADSTSEHWQHSDQLSESHSYEHDPTS